MSEAGSSSLGNEDSLLLITRACDMCRKKKIRCEVTSGTCVQCIRYKTQCHFTPISVKRKPRRSVRIKQVEELQQKLQWMEKQLNRATERQVSVPHSDLRNDRPLLETPNSSQSRSGIAYLDEIVSGDGLINYSPAMSAESPEVSNANNSSHETPSSSVPDNQITISHWIPTFDNNEFMRPYFKVLPPKDETLDLIKKSFKGFYSAYPLFDIPTFISTFESQGTDITDLRWWACLNVVLALRTQFLPTMSGDKEEDRQAWGYFQNALAVTNQLMTMHSTISSVQALLGMSLVILGTPNQGPASLLISSAIKLAHRIGLHRRSHELGLSQAEINERNRVFWIAYCLDKDISLQTGQPPTQDDEDMDVELPFENNFPEPHPGELNRGGYFSFRARLAIIQGEIYTRLLSVKAGKQSTTERIIAARDLESRLEVWRACVPSDYLRRPGTQGPAVETGRHPAILQLTYFKCLAIVYGSLPTLPIYREVAIPDDSNRYQIKSAAIYATQARKAIQLLPVIPRRKHACIWSVLHIFVTATKTLLTHTISNPSNAQAQADLELMEPLLTLMGMLAASGESNKVGEIYQSCVEMFNMARTAVLNASLPDISPNQTRIMGRLRGEESMQDFLRRMENIREGYDGDMN